MLMSGYTGLMERMASALGIDLARLLARGVIDEGNVERMMTHCALCDAPEDCARRLHESRVQAEPPHYCPNQKTLLYLRDHPHND